MIPQILPYLPCTLCLAFVAFYCVFTSKLRSCRMGVLLLLISCVAFFANATLYTSIATDNQLFVMQLISQLTTPALIPVALLYFRSFRKARSQNPVGLLVLLLPFALFIAELMQVAFLGHAESVTLIREIVHGQPAGFVKAHDTSALRTCMVTLFAILLEVEYILLLIACLRVIARTKKSQKNWRAFFKGRSSISTSLLVAVSLILLFTLFLARYCTGILTDSIAGGVVLDLLLSAALFLTFFNGMFEAKETVTLTETLNAFRYNSVHYEDLATQRTKMPVQTVQEEVVTWAKEPSPTEQADTEEETEEDSLQQRFEELMTNDLLYLMPGISLSHIAKRLGTNKTYLSRMVNSSYGLAFPDYVNQRRIDYAKQYILHNRGVRQHEVATACGFSSPSAYTNMFKKYTGMTPKVWIATYCEQ